MGSCCASHPVPRTTAARPDQQSAFSLQAGLLEGGRGFRFAAMPRKRWLAYSSAGTSGCSRRSHSDLSRSRFSAVLCFERHALMACSRDRHLNATRMPAFFEQSTNSSTAGLHWRKDSSFIFLKRISSTRCGTLITLSSVGDCFNIGRQQPSATSVCLFLSPSYTALQQTPVSWVLGVVPVQGRDDNVILLKQGGPGMPAALAVFCPPPPSPSASRPHGQFAPSATRFLPPPAMTTAISQSQFEEYEQAFALFDRYVPVCNVPLLHAGKQHPGRRATTKRLTVLFSTFPAVSFCVRAEILTDACHPWSWRRS